MLPELVTSGFMIEVILALVVLEAIVLTAYRRWTTRGLSASQLLPNLVAGGALLLSVRLALADAWWGWLAAALLMALLAHLLDLGMRWSG